MSNIICIHGKSNTRSHFRSCSSTVASIDALHPVFFIFLCGRMFYSPLSEGFYLIMTWSTQLKIDGLKWVTWVVLGREGSCEILTKSFIKWQLVYTNIDPAPYSQYTSRCGKWSFILLWNISLALRTPQEGHSNHTINLLCYILFQ